MTVSPAACGCSRYLDARQTPRPVPVPKNYIGTAKIILRWATSATSGNSLWKVNYKAIADGESHDPSTDDEDASFGSIAVPGTARLEKESTLP